MPSSSMVQGEGGWWCGGDGQEDCDAGVGRMGERVATDSSFT